MQIKNFGIDSILIPPRAHTPFTRTAAEQHHKQEEPPASQLLHKLTRQSVGLKFMSGNDSRLLVYIGLLPLTAF